MPGEENKISKYNHGEKSIKVLFTISTMSLYLKN